MTRRAVAVIHPFALAAPPGEDDDNYDDDDDYDDDDFYVDDDYDDL